MPGVAIISLACFYYQLESKSLSTTTSSFFRTTFFQGFCYGLGFFGLGVSWIYVSIHSYGHLNPLLSALFTFCFISYLSLFPALAVTIFKGLTKTAWPRLFIPSGPLLKLKHLAINLRYFSAPLLFSALWVLSEYARATLMTGFPWLLVGFGQYDAPTRYFLPWFGVYGASFFTCFAAGWLAECFLRKTSRQYLTALPIVLLLLLPLLFRKIEIHQKQTFEKPLTVAVIQANLSMRDKWDERLFDELLLHYQEKTLQALGTQLIVMPESAIPLPYNYVKAFLLDLDWQAKKAKSAILFGIPKSTKKNSEQYFNALMSIGTANGIYLKQHLVPFGEYIPSLMQSINRWLDLPESNLASGQSNQPPILIHHYPIASLICYELAYGNLLRRQLPEAAWIVSISDAGWFGHSLAMYQQQQMAQVLSMETARYQVFANNDGLSSVINAQGKIVQALPAFKAGVLHSSVQPLHSITPWVNWGDRPILSICWLILGVRLFYSLGRPIAAKYKRRYSYQPQ
ncbi:MAG: apolipoprotein N-acyltransferase [Legionella sp.]|nr:apolipoprotein N-acyltransferase [Legionella sp.]